MGTEKHTLGYNIWERTDIRPRCLIRPVSPENPLSSPPSLLDFFDLCQTSGKFCIYIEISVEKFWLEFRKALPLHPLSPFSGVGGTKRKSSLTDCTDRSSTRKRHAPSPVYSGYVGRVGYKVQNRQCYIEKVL